ncbi:hypothetical protein C8R44DRAFT_985335 [Mycena epipterygia]|nr:hypothetical protein C8R44DRAFT_985335 [Mycena epipterygia]
MSQISNELWFHYLPRDTVKDVSFTHRRFARLSRPLRFTDFDFHPYELHGLRLPSADEVQRSLERLTFWCSDDIAPLVRACHVVPWMENVGPVGSFPPKTHHTSCYPRSLSASRASPAFSDFIAGACISRKSDGEPVSLASGAPPYHQFFLLHNDINSEDELDHWIALLHPECLGELDLMCNPRLFNEAMAALPSFPHVRKLAVKIRLSTGTLSKFPALEVLDNGPSMGYTAFETLCEFFGHLTELRIRIPFDVE